MRVGTVAALSAPASRLAANASGAMVDVTEPELFSGRIAPAVACSAAIAIPLIYVPVLESPFSAPKLGLLLLAGTLGLGIEAIACVRSEQRLAWRPSMVLIFAAFLFASGLSSAIAAHGPAPGAPYAKAELLRQWAMLGVGVLAGRAFASRTWTRRLLEAMHAAAGVVSALGILQHLEILPFSIPTISVPGSTFGNRNLAAEAVALTVPFGLALVFPRELTSASSSRGAAESGPRSIGLEEPLADVRTRRMTPVAELRTRRRPRALLLFFLILELLYLAATRTRGAWVGCALGIVTFFALCRPRRGVHVLGGALALGIAVIATAAIPGRWTSRDALDAKRFASGARVAADALDPTSPVVRTRLGLWRRALAIYRDHPVFGAGLGNFAVLFPRYAEPNAARDGVLSPTLAPRRPHDDLIERLAETGPFGLATQVALYVIAGLLALKSTKGLRSRVGSHVAGGPSQHAERAQAPCAVESQSATAAAAAAASLAAFFGCGLTGFPLAMPGTAFVAAVALGGLAIDPSRPAGEHARVRRGSRSARSNAAVFTAGAFTIAVTIGAGFWSARRLVASYWLRRAEAAFGPTEIAEGARRALAALDRAERSNPGQFTVALATSHAALYLGRSAEASSAAIRALASEPYSPNAWEALAEARFLAQDASGAATAAQRAIALLHDYPQALGTLAQASARLGDWTEAESAIGRLRVLAKRSDASRRLAVEIEQTLDQERHRSGANPNEHAREPLR